jgi:zinc transport system ATP-binding protein
VTGSVTSPEPDVLVDLHDASFGYAEHPVVHRASAIVRRRDVLAVLGPNGSGKSTLVKGMLGLVPRLGGQVSLFGRSALTTQERRRVGYVPQHLPGSGAVPATVQEVVATGRLAHHGPFSFRPWLSGPDRLAVSEAIGAVDLADRAGASVRTLSGGQQRRTILARALATQPELLVLDEPTAGLDRASQETLAEVLTGLVAGGLTVVVVTHGLGLLGPLVTRTLELRDGSVVHDAPHDQTNGEDDHHHHPPGEQRPSTGPGLMG